MAKRFADTALTRQAWYRMLAPVYKAAWRFLCDECDEAGVWAVDEASIEFHVGAVVPVDVLVSAINADGKTRIKRVGKAKLLLVGFIPFQYGELSTDCKPHQKVIRTLRKHSLWEGYAKGFQTLEEEEEEEDKEEEKEEGGTGGDFAAPSPASPRATFPSELAKSIDECANVFIQTLVHFGQGRTLLAHERTAIGRAIQQYTAPAVKFALEGARYEPKNEKFNPADWVSLKRYLDPKNFERMVGFGVKRAHQTGGAA